MCSMPKSFCLVFFITVLIVSVAEIQAQDKIQQVVTESYVWKNVEIVGGGFIPGIIFSTKQKGLIYARTDMGGAYRWNSDTKRWIPLTDWLGWEDWNLIGIESIAPDPIDANRVYMAVGTYMQPWAGNGAILSSADQGQTWKRTNMPFKMGGNQDGRSMGERLAVDPNKNNILYFGSRKNGLWKSTDYGVTWSKVSTFPVGESENGIGIAFVLFDKSSARFQEPTKNIYVGVADSLINLYRSTDGGATWNPVPDQAKKNNLIPHHGVLTQESILYLTYSNGPGPNGVSNGAVWKYDTKNDTWTDITPIVPGNNFGYVVPGTKGAGNFGYAGLTVDASNPSTLMVSTLDRWNPGDDIFRSTNGGFTWKAVRAKSERDSSISPYLNWGHKTAEFGHWIGDVEIDPFNPNHVLYVTGATIWGSDNVTDVDSGNTIYWTVRAQGVEENAILDLISPPSEPHLISGMGDIGGFVHDDLTISPREGMLPNPFLSGGNSLDFAQGKPSIIVRVGTVWGDAKQHGGYSLDSGKTWTSFTSEPDKSRGGGKIAVSADGSNFVWTPDRASPHYSQDHGANWVPCNGIKENLSVISDRINPNKFYTFDSNTGGLYISTDGGINFSINNPTDTLIGRGKLYAAPTQEGDLWFAMGERGIYHSTNSGANFIKLENVQEGYALGFGKAAPKQNYPAIYITGKIGDVRGVFRSDDGGNKWVRINDDQHQYGWIGQVIIGDPRIYGRVYLGTNGRGILYADPK